MNFGHALNAFATLFLRLHMRFSTTYISRYVDIVHATKNAQLKN